MKKFCMLVLTLTLLFVLSPAAFAASSETYRLDDLGMSIDIPSEYIVFTRDIADDDPNLSLLGLNKKDLLASMENINAYLDVWARNFEFTLGVYDTEIDDFNLFSDAALIAFESAIADESGEGDITVEKCELYRHDQTKFIKRYEIWPNGTDTDYCLWYSTVYDGKAIDIVMFSYSGEIGPEEESILQSIVSTVHFDQEPLTLPDTEAFLYRDENTGIEFTVPANWRLEPPSQDLDLINATFSSNREPGLYIILGSIERRKKMPPSKEDFAKAMGTEKSEVSTVSYGGKEYYKYTITIPDSIYGIDFETIHTRLTSFENGYAYVFNFSGDSTSPYYGDFEALLESAKYPTVESTSPPNYDKPAESAPSSSYNNPVESAPSSHYKDPAESTLPSYYNDPVESTPPSGYADKAIRTTSPDSDFEYSGINLLVSLLITVTIYSVPIFIYRYAIVKQPVEKRRAKIITIAYGVVAFIVMCFVSFAIIAINGSGAAVG